MAKHSCPYSILAIFGGTSRQNVQQQKCNPSIWLERRIVKIAKVKPKSNRYDYVYDFYVKNEIRNALVNHYNQVKLQLEKLNVNITTGKQTVNRKIGNRVKWDLNGIYKTLFGGVYKGNAPLTLLSMLAEFIGIAKKEGIDPLINKFISKYYSIHKQLPQFKLLFDLINCKLLKYKYKQELKEYL